MLAATAIGAAALANAAGDEQRGARAFGACVACHSLEPGRHLTGPSLSAVMGRKAGTLGDFARYSQALRDSGIVWTEQTLDRWLHGPEALVPGNLMHFRGVKDDRARADLVAFLKAASAPGSPLAGRPRAFPDLKSAPPGARVVAIRRCKDSYFVTDGAGETRPYWEFNLRFKTDSSPSGPQPGKPVMVGQGMQGDRAQVVFSAPQEISAFVREGC
ncbi:MAG: cytochrome C [Pseudomonadota bacterium]